MKNKTIGWIGTGLMGGPMAMHLVDAGYKIIVYNRTKEKAQSLIDRGCPWYDSPSAVAAESDVIFTIIGLPKDVEDVYFGENGIFQTLKSGTTLVDMTTTLPSLAERIFHKAKDSGCTSIDAPVSGGEVGAINGALSVMVGGEKNAVEEIMPLFNIFGKSIIYQGPAGSGQHTKMCNQITIAGTMIGVCEALLYGYRAGLDLDTVLSSISKGAAGCWTLDVLAPKIVQDDFAPGFMVDHFVKDLGIALKEAEAMHLSLPGLVLAKQLYIALQEEDNGRLGTQALYLVLKNISGIK